MNNSIKVGPLVFLLWMFLITENIMKRPVDVGCVMPSLNAGPEGNKWTQIKYILIFTLEFLVQDFERSQAINFHLIITDLMKAIGHMQRIYFHPSLHILCRQNDGVLIEHYDCFKDRITGHRSSY